MNTYLAYKQIIKVEESTDLSGLKFQSFDLWPLLRQALWTELLNKNSKKNQNDDRKKNSFSQKIVNLFYTLLRAASFELHEFKNRNAEKLFISRPVYLQKITDTYFDKIVDPLITLIKGRETFAKYYVSSHQNNISLEFPATIIQPSYFYHKNNELIKHHKKVVFQIAELTDINCEKLWYKYNANVNQFARWYKIGKRILKGKDNLKEIYLTCWYFPDMMGICAAANQRGIETIDIQHGKQGLYQGMYSGWTIIPDCGYDLMPDYFWCWGKTSCDHILRDSTKRKKHLPFVGGFPWLHYYKNNLLNDNRTNNDNKRTVLVTTQPPQGSNEERIPDFIINFLLATNESDIHFNFRCHPNDHNGHSYCISRLKLVDPALYSINTVDSNLYDTLIQSTHHITAFSSCCYEASSFDVPTLLYGEEAKHIYNDDITAGLFSWTDNNISDLELWLSETNTKKIQKPSPYIAEVSDYTFKAKNFIS